MKNIDWNYFDDMDEDEGVTYAEKDFEVSSIEELKKELRYTNNIYSIRPYDEDHEMIDDFEVEDIINFDWSDIENFLDEASYIEVCWEF